ncbi:T9SS type A sorting domain-containing protein, partial [bacterium]|nr:T9SS type A sorting domain-containing protein [bacterium]
NDYIGYYGDGFPEVLTVTGNVSGLDILVEPLPFTTISGTLTCPAGYSGLTLVYAASDPYFEEITNFSIALTLDGNADYTLFVDPGEYYVMAHLDADFSFAPSSADPQFFWGAPNFPSVVDVTDMNAEGIDLPLIAPQDVEVTLEPVGAPIVIPASGGTFDYIVGGSNNQSEPANVQVWLDATLPDGSASPPLLGPVQMTLPVGFTSDRQRSQAIPSYAPAGQYSFNAHVGIYPVIVWNEASFDLEKSASGSDEIVSDWFSYGDELENWVRDWEGTGESVSVETYNLISVYPNPFNPTTSISYHLSAVSHVNISVYDVSGRLVAELIDGFRDAGSHEVTFDAVGLSSGIYLYKLTTDQHQSMGKMVLMK